ncbi:MAG: DUF2058 domain-containing protein, partial [Gammaproteobacteria bacterium]|nr:DUF2058 domain-containing protein [Gammaproteobacteria bacterium]
ARDNCEIAYNFQHDTAVRSIYVNDSLRQSLISGTLAIVFVDERYELVPSPVAERIRERDASYIVDTESSDTQPDEDDPYKDFVVPDDLNW